MTHSNRDAYSRTSDWLIGTARRHPEGLLLLAAGCALLMRSGGSSSARTASRDYQKHDDEDRSHTDRGGSSVRQKVARAADGAVEYASDLKDRVADTAASYAESVSEFADDTRRNVSEQTERFARQAQSTVQDSFSRVLREQPLAVAVVGLAAGAAVAAVFPATDIENRTFGGARDALTTAANKAGENLMGAASKAGERLKSAAEERGLTGDGLKKMAGQVADTFTSAISDAASQLGSGVAGRDRPATVGSSAKPDQMTSQLSPTRASPSTSPATSPASSSAVKRDGTDMARPGTGSDRGNR